MARSHNLFTEEGRTRFRNFGLRVRSYALAFVCIGIVSGWLIFERWTYQGFAPLERIYFRQYLKASLWAQFVPESQGKYVLLVGPDGPTTRKVLTDEDAVPVIENGEYKMVASQVVFRGYDGEPKWRLVRWNHREICRGLSYVYGGSSYWQLFMPAVLGGLLTLMCGLTLAVSTDYLINRHYESGKRLRGTRLVQFKEFAKELTRQWGLTLMVTNPAPVNWLWRAWRVLLAKPTPTFPLPIQHMDESKHVLITGDTGSGKSQIIHRYLKQLAKRGETVVVYDPALEFVEAHFNAARGDRILNPLDERSLWWSFSNELKLKTDADMLADAFFPRHSAGYDGESKFFKDATHNVLMMLLMHQPTPAELLVWLSREDVIDAALKASPMSHFTAAGAPAQRSGVLGNMARMARTLQLLPSHKECRTRHCFCDVCQKQSDDTPDPAFCSNTFSFTEWAEHRQGWLFLTSQKDQEEALRQLYSAWLDILMRRLLSGRAEDSAQKPVKIVIDEMQTLGHVSSIGRLLTEGRKFGIGLIMGLQNLQQIYYWYGRDMAKTMIASPRTKIIMQCNEPESARYLADMIGNEESEIPSTGITASVSDEGRDSIHYNSQRRQNIVVMPEQIMGMKELTGYMKFRDMVVNFGLEFRAMKRVALGFVARQSLLPEVAVPRLTVPAEQPKEPNTVAAAGGLSLGIFMPSTEQKTTPGYKSPRWYGASR